MAKTSAPEQHPPVEPRETNTLNALIGRQVLRALGDPADLLQVQVRRVWEGHYRVNIVLGADVTAARIAHSYFLGADDKGTILASTPKLTREYDRSPSLPN